MRVRTIRQLVTFRADPQTVYEALMDSAKHSEIICSKAEISREVGGRFQIREAGLSGTNLELVPGRKIVQHWRAEADDWPDDHYTKVTFRLQPINGGTLLKFSQTEVPERHYEAISRAWNIYYWQAMKAVLER